MTTRLRFVLALALTVSVLWGASSGNIQWTQLASSARHGSTGTKGQSSDGTGATGDVATFDSNGNLTDGGATPGVPLHTGTSHTFSGNNDYFICTGACTITVPAPSISATGTTVQYCVANDDNVTTVITLAAIGSSARYENTARTAYGTAGTGTMVSGGAAADKICIVARDSTHYLTLTSQGTWTAS